MLAPGLVSNNVSIDSSGNEIRYNPAFTGNFSAEFTLDQFLNVESFFRVDAIHTGSFFIDNFEFNEVDSATRFNLRAGAQLTENLGVEIFGTNITDDLTPTTNGGTTSGFSGTQRRFFATAPRGSEFGLRVTADF